MDTILPSKDDCRWRDLLESKITHNFSLLAAGLCVSRNIRMLKRKNTEETYQTAIEDVYMFFQKYEKMLKNDIAEIFK
ncbi:MAG: hypothetical protein FWC26_06930 [Fibromonadales bacterium]|nr:hypothetical protein [Fibromonadales bacterium]